MTVCLQAITSVTSSLKLHACGSVCVCSCERLCHQHMNGAIESPGNRSADIVMVLWDSVAFAFMDTSGP